MESVHRRDVVRALALGSVWLSIPAWAKNDPHTSYTPYTFVNPPVPTESRPGRQEVIDFFSYGCPHCRRFWPFLNAWRAQRPDVDVVSIPVTYNRKRWETYARLYWALHADEDKARWHTLVFEAIHTQKNALDSERAIARWANTHGRDGDRVIHAMRSPAVDALMEKSLRVTRAYSVNQVPLLAVEGRFLVPTGHLLGFDGMLHVVDHLLRKHASPPHSRERPT
jgi:protein dithiol oxidoreductase (disulfide-forming)